MKWGAIAVTGGVAALTLAVGVALLSDAEAGKPDEERALPVRVARAKALDGFEVRERVAGRVTSQRSGVLGFEHGGRIARVSVREGDRVVEGALLAELDTRERTAERRELAARLESTREQLALAKLTVGRQNELHEAKFLAPQALDEAVSSERTLRARLEADDAALQRVDVAIELAELRAPYPLIVADRKLDEGAVVAPGEAIFSVLEDAPQKIEVGVAPEMASGLELDRVYAVETARGTLSARLVAVIPEIDTATRTQTAILFVEADQPRVADGSLAQLRLARSVEARGFWVPVGALSEGRRGTWSAFAVVPDAEGIERIERRQVEIIQSEEDRAFVRGTLADGDALVVDGLHRLAPGVRVRIQDELISHHTAAR